MYATTANQLVDMINDNPDDMPSTFLMDSSFAAYCYDKKTFVWLKSAFQRDADLDDCDKWRLSRTEWKEQVEMALIAIRATQKTS